MTSLEIILIMLVYLLCYVTGFSLCVIWRQRKTIIAIKKMIDAYIDDAARALNQ